MTGKPSNAKFGKAEGRFLSRWSDRKLENPAEQRAGNYRSLVNINHMVVDKSDEIEPPDSAVEEATDPDRDIVNTLSSIALARFLQNPECSVLDGLNEYDDDFSYFVPRGDLITQEMKVKLDRLFDPVSEQAIPPDSNPVGSLSAESNSEADSKV